MKQERGHLVDVLFTLALFCVFAATALIAVILGADIYSNTVSSMNRNYNTRTSISYLAEKVRQGDTAGGIATAQVNGQDALVLTQMLDGKQYETWIYTGDGELREVMVASGMEVKPQDGQSIMPIASLELQQNGALLTMTATDPQGEVSRLVLRTRCY